MLSRVNVGGGGGALGDPTSGYALVVSYPIGAVCTCSDGTKTYKSRDTVGVCIFYVPSTGNWTVSADLNGDTVSKVVSVSSYGRYDVELSFEYVLFDSSVNRLGAQGAWTPPNGGVHNYTVESSKITIEGKINGKDYGLYTANTFDVTDYDYLAMSGSFTKTYYKMTVGVCATNPEKPASAGVVGYTELTTTQTLNNMIICNLTNATGYKYLYFMTDGTDSGSQDYVVNKLEITKVSLKHNY